MFRNGKAVLQAAKRKTNVVMVADNDKRNNTFVRGATGVCGRFPDGMKERGLAPRDSPAGCSGCSQTSR
jgi:hypothetical protein